MLKWLGGALKKAYGFAKRAALFSDIRYVVTAKQVVQMGLANVLNVASSVAKIHAPAMFLKALEKKDEDYSLAPGIEIPTDYLLFASVALAFVPYAVTYLNKRLLMSVSSDYVSHLINQIDKKTNAVTLAELERQHESGKLKEQILTFQQNVFSNACKLPNEDINSLSAIMDTGIACAFLGRKLDLRTSEYFFLYMAGEILLNSALAHCLDLDAQRRELEKQTREHATKQQWPLLDNALTVRAFNNQEKEAKKSAEIEHKIRDIREASERDESSFQFSKKIIPFGMSLILAHHLLGLGRERFQEKAFLIIYFNIIAASCENLATSFRSLDLIFEKLDEVTAFLDHPYEQENFEDKEQKEDLPGTVRFDQVDFSYQDRSVLKDVSFSVKPGETVALVGPIGIGKSTIAKLLTGFIKPQQGKVIANGLDPTQTSVTRLRTGIAYLQQGAVLFPRSIRKNIQMGFSETSLNIEVDPMTTYGANATLDPVDVLLTQTGFPVSALNLDAEEVSVSAGQKQLINIARLLAKSSNLFGAEEVKVVVLDEPTTSLDPDTARRVMEKVRQMTDGKTKIIITHNFDHIGKVDKVLVLEGGKITEWDPKRWQSQNSAQLESSLARAQA